jgi:hypothetical protein
MSVSQSTKDTDNLNDVILEMNKNEFNLVKILQVYFSDGAVQESPTKSINLFIMIFEKTV